MKKAKKSSPTESLDTLPGVLAALKKLAKKSNLDGMSRYGIPSDHAWGVAMGDVQKLAKRVGRNHQLAVNLWKTGVYEARLLTAFVEEPERLTAAQMNRWCRDFDNWAIVDTLCFKLFDQTPLAFAAVERWSRSKEEFVKRAAFALMASLALHAKDRPDSAFKRYLPLIEQAAGDDRNFVKKGVSWALKALGTRKGLRKDVLKLAKDLAASEDAAPRWLGKDALRGLG